MNKFSILWLDINATDPISSFRAKLGDVQPFTEVNDCIHYIQSHPNEPIYLIVSGSFAERTVPQIYESSNLIQIFLFCGSISKYNTWGLDYCDKMLMFDHGDDLLTRLWRELEIKLREQANLCFQQAEEFKQRALQYKQASCG
jgi:hypothetical protein